MRKPKSKPKENEMALQAIGGGALPKTSIEKKTTTLWSKAEA